METHGHNKKRKVLQMTTTADYADVLANKLKEESGRTKETLDRVRRIETKLTSFLEAQGHDTESDRVMWEDGAIKVPSLAVSLRDVLAAIPSLPAEVEIFHKGKHVAWLR
jgi:hypothetical protein